MITSEDISNRKLQLEQDIQEIDANLIKLDQTRLSLVQQKQAMQGALALCDEFINNIDEQGTKE